MFFILRDSIVDSNSFNEMNSAEDSETDGVFGFHNLEDLLVTLNTIAFSATSVNDLQCVHTSLAFFQRSLAWG